MKNEMKMYCHRNQVSEVLTCLLVFDLIREGGTLRRASIEYDGKHQVILPEQSHLIELIIRDIHEKVTHLCF